MSHHAHAPGRGRAHRRRHEEHGHAHGLIDPAIVRSRGGVRAVASSLGILGLTALLQLALFLLTGSVALLADLIHNVGDALTAVPLGIAFVLRSVRGERIAGRFVVLAILVSALVALYETIVRFVDPQPPSHLGALAGAGAIGFLGNELAAHVRLRAGRRLASPALIADGAHARSDGIVSLGVTAGAAGVWLGVEVADPIVGLLITLVILKITWDSWRVVATVEPGSPTVREDHGPSRTTDRRSHPRVPPAPAPASPGAHGARDGAQRGDAAAGGTP